MINELSKKLIDDARSVLEAKKLDPVGKEDDDVDNDGDVDSSDEYLKKRRAAISKAMKDEGNAFSKALMAAREKGEDEFVVAGKKYQVKEVEELEKDKDKKDIKEDLFFDLSEAKLSPISKKFIDMMNDMMKHKHGSKEFKAKKAEIDMFLKKNSGKM